MFISARTSFLFATLAAGIGSAQQPTFELSPPPPTSEERPVIATLHLSPQSGQLALIAKFNAAPWGDECKNRCANATVFLDTDNNPKTGMKVNDAAAPENGADLAITIQGIRETSDTSSKAQLVVKLRQMPQGTATIEDGTMVADLELKRDSDRVWASGNEVRMLVDTSASGIPAGTKMRVIYHPPQIDAVTATTMGFLDKKALKNVVFKNGELTDVVVPKPGKKK